jgi:hypothetical protein
MCYKEKKKAVATPSTIALWLHNLELQLTQANQALLVHTYNPSYVGDRDQGVAVGGQFRQMVVQTQS